MAKHCRSCGQTNEDDRIFCSACGEPLNSDLQLIMDLDKMTKTPRKTEPTRTQAATDDDDYVPPRTTQTKKKKKSAAPWIILAIVVIAVIAFILLK